MNGDGLPDRLRVEDPTPFSNDGDGRWKIAYGTPSGFETDASGALVWSTWTWDAGVASVARHDGNMNFVPTAVYTQDADGSVTGTTKSTATTLFDRDDDGRIRSVREEPSGSLIVDSFHYDLSGERIEKIRMATTLNAPARHQYYVDAGYEVDALAGTHEVHLFAGGRRVATSKRPGLGAGNPLTTAADAVEFYHPDHVGSNTLVSDSHGQTVQESFLTPFGELHALVDGAGSPVSPSGSTTPHLFTDQEHDPETGLHYFGARYYDPWIGRFLSQDPELIGPSPGVTFYRIEDDPQHLNPYAYALNRPTTLTDPTGAFEIFFDGSFGLGGGDSAVGFGRRLNRPEDVPVVWEGGEPDWGDLGPDISFEIGTGEVEARPQGTQVACGPATPLCVIILLDALGKAAAVTGAGLLTIYTGSEVWGLITQQSGEGGGEGNPPDVPPYNEDPTAPPGEGFGARVQSVVDTEQQLLLAYLRTGRISSNLHFDPMMTICERLLVT